MFRGEFKFLVFWPSANQVLKLSVQLLKGVSRTYFHSKCVSLKRRFSESETKTKRKKINKQTGIAVLNNLKGNGVNWQSHFPRPQFGELLLYLRWKDGW